MTPSYASAATQPRLLALANSERLVGVVGFEVDNNSFYQADTFHITLCLSAQPASRNWAWWASQVDIELEMLVGYPANPQQFDRSDLTSLLIGEVDDIEIDPVRDEIVMSGRDLTSRFIDNKTAESFRNQTASQIATLLALRRGLVPVVTTTTLKAGTYYDIDKVGDSDDRPEWDLLTYLAQVSGFQVYVKGRELHFEPKTVDAVKRTVIDKTAMRARYDQISALWGAELDKVKATNKQASALLDQRDATSDPGQRASLTGQAKALNDQANSTQLAARTTYKSEYESLRAQLAGPDFVETTTSYIVRWQPPAQNVPAVNAVSLSMQRNLTIAKDIVVTVRSYNLKQKKGFTVTANRTRVKSGTKTASKSYIAPQKYFFTIANKTAAEAQAYANQKLAEISQHEMKIEVTLPGDPALNPRLLLKLEGTGTAFDQVYYPASVLHAIGLNGYKTTIRAKNSSPDSTVAP